MDTSPAWEDGFQDDIQCPYCGTYDYEHTDYPDALRGDGDSAEVDCYKCGRKFLVTLCVSCDYASAPLPAPSPVSSQTKQEEP